MIIVTADDFGKSLSVNRAVSIAKDEGILTSASVMITGERWEDAISLAKEKDIDIGIHVSVTEGKSLSLGKRINISPAKIGLLAQFSKQIFSWIKKEISFQFRKASSLFRPSHINSHHHIHIHPKILKEITENCKRFGVRCIRFPYEPWNIYPKEHIIRNSFYRIAFSALSKNFKKEADSAGLIYPDGIIGLYKTGEITEEWLIFVLEKISKKKGIFEIYLHLDDRKGTKGFEELKAVTSSKVRRLIEDLEIRLISFSDLIHI